MNALNSQGPIGPFFATRSNDPSEPVFVIGASDPSAILLLTAWADDRTQALSRGELPPAAMEDIIAARVLVVQMEYWQKAREAAAAKKLPDTAYELPATTAPVPAPPVSDPPPPAPTKSAVKPKPNAKLTKAVIAEAGSKPLAKAPAAPKSGRVKLAK